MSISRSSSQIHTELNKLGKSFLCQEMMLMTDNKCNHCGLRDLKKLLPKEKIPERVSGAVEFLGILAARSLNGCLVATR